MKKIITTLLSVFAAVQVMAQIPTNRPEMILPHKQMDIISKNGQIYNPAIPRSERIEHSKSDVLKTQNKTLPEGSKTYYTMDIDFLNGNNLTVSKDTVGATILCKYEDNRVALLNPFPIFPSHESVYLDGVIEGDKMKFSLPVTIDTHWDKNYILSMLRFDPEEYTYRIVEDSENILEVQINEDGKMSIRTTDVEPVISDDLEECVFPEIILGIITEYTYEDKVNWEIGGTWNIDFTPITLNSAPEGIEFEEWSLGQADPDMKYSIVGWTRIAGVAIDGNDIYIKGISEYSEDSIIKGTIENGVATFSGIQNAGFCPGYNLICYFVATEASFNGNKFEIGEDIPLKMILDMEHKTLKSKDVMMWCVADPISRSWLNTWFEPMCIANIPENLNAPLEKTYYCSGFDNISFNAGYILVYYIPNININGCVLDKSLMYYNAYLNGEKYTFSKDLYNLPEDMSNIPMDYGDDVYIASVFSDGTEAYGLWFMDYNTKLFTTGIQTFYEGSDGVLYHSPLNEVDPGFYSSVKDVQSDNVSPISEEFYTVDGMKVTNPTDGIYIKVSNMSDGTRKVEKFMK